MRKSTLILLLALLVSVTLFARIPEKLKEIRANTPTLHTIAIPDVVHMKLPNGLTVMIVEDHRIPLVSGRLMFRGGSVFDPDEKVGLAAIATEVMRTGGTTDKSGDELDEILENISASIEASARDEAAYVSFSCLKENLPEVLDTFKEVIEHPAFREDKVKLAISQAKSGISRRNDEAQGIAYREFARILYGKDSPYARIEEYATLDAITRDDLVAYHRNFLFPSNGILAIWGDVDVKAIKKRIKSLFKEWKDEGRRVRPYPEPSYTMHPGNYFTDKGGINQSYIQMGHFGIKRDNPDYYALEVMNRIFGTGGFASRLFKNVRSTKGLTYGCYGGVNYEMTHRGAFKVTTFTRSPKTVDAINAVMEEIQKLKKDGVTEEELAYAKKAFFEKFVFNFDTVDKLIRRLQYYAFYGYPEDTLQVLKKKIEQVTVADVNRVAKKYLHPDEMIIYVVGNGKDIQPPLSTIGAFTSWDVTIPEPKAEAVPQASAGDLEKGHALMEEVYEAHGGKAIAVVKAKKVSEELTIAAGGQNISLTSDQLIVYPEKIHITITMPFGTMEQVYNGEKAWIKTAQGAKAYDSKEFKEGMWREFLLLLKNLNDPAYTFQDAGEGKVGERKVEVVIVKHGEKSMKLYIDPETHRIAGAKYQGKTQMGPATLETIYTGYTTVDNVVYPSGYSVTADEKPYITSKVNSVVFNPEVPADTFKAPDDLK